MKYLNKTINAFIILLICSSTANAKPKMQEFQSTRLMQTAGAGAASLLINEGTLLNPAAVSFFTDSTLYYQKSNIELYDSAVERNFDYNTSNSEFYNITDTTTSLKGGFSYLYQREEFGTRKRIALSSSIVTSKQTSIGFIYKYTDEDSLIKSEKYDEYTISALYNYSRDFILGFVYVDPTINISEYSHYTIGAQYRFNPFITIIGDIGSGDMKNSEKTSFTKFAVQISPTERVFLRYGMFHDKFTNYKGIGYGISWVGPKFAFDYAIKTSEILSESTDELLADESLVETSMGITILF